MNAATARFDHTLVMLWIVALAIGLVTVASATLPKSAASGEGAAFVLRQLVYMGAGAAVFAICASLPLRLWSSGYRIALLAALVLCILVLIPGIGVSVAGAQRWISLGFATLQPSEIAKLLLVVYLAGHLSRHEDALRGDMVALLRPMMPVALLCALLLLQPDFGAVVLIAAVTAGMLFIGGARLRDFFVILLLAGAALALLSVLQPYRVQRLLTFVDPWSYAYGSGYQLTQALIAFGRGEWLGLGLGEGIQKLFYLPEAHNDFIFAVIAEEIGLIGAAAVLALLLLLVLRMLRIAREALGERRRFAGYLAYGGALLIGAQCLINVGVNTGMLPTKGLTLPFISYGGNSLLVCSALLGLALRAHLEGNPQGMRAEARP